MAVPGNRSRFPRNFVRGQRRKVSWSLGVGGPTGAITASAIVLLPVAAQALLDDLTLIRVHGEIQVSLVSASAVGEGYNWAFGMCNVTENAFGIGVTALPDPLGDIGWDGWFVHMQGNMFARDATPLDDPNLLIHRVIDSKAMRKTHNTDVIVGIFSAIESGTAVLRGDVRTRILDKLA